MSQGERQSFALTAIFKSVISSFKSTNLGSNIQEIETSSDVSVLGATMNMVLPSATALMRRDKTFDPVYLIPLSRKPANV